MDGHVYYESQPLQVDLCPLKTKEPGDSGIPMRMMNSKQIKPWAGSKRGLHYVSAMDHIIPNVGEVCLDIETTEGHQDSVIFQVAGVNKPLMFMSDQADNRCRVGFDQDGVTGEDLTHIYNNKTKKRMKLRRCHGQ